MPSGTGNLKNAGSRKATRWLEHFSKLTSLTPALIHPDWHLLNTDCCGMLRRVKPAWTAPEVMNTAN